MIPLEAERAAPFVGPGARVLDLGASTGTFTRWALDRDAHVVALEPYPPNAMALRILAVDYPGRATVLALAAGPSGSARLIVPDDHAARSTGCVAVSCNIQKRSLIDMVPFAMLRAVIDADVVKCDIQGGEYALFADADDATLQRCRFISIERHGWTTPDQEPIEGWGVLDGPPMPPNAYATLHERMARTHDVIEDADLLYCYLR